MTEDVLKTATANVRGGSSPPLDRVSADEVAPATKEGGLVSWIGGFYSGVKREWWPRAIMLFAAILVLGTLCLMLFPQIGAWDDSTHKYIDVHLGLIIMFACWLPLLLAGLSYLLINKRAVCQHIHVEFPDDVDAEARQEAESAWSYERERAQWSLARAEVFAGIWGMLTTVSVAGCITFLVPPLHPLEAPFGSQPRNLVALAVIGAAATSFLLDLARLCLRAANDDATKQMFAQAVRTSILSVVSTLVLALLFRHLAPSNPSSASGSQPFDGNCLEALGFGVAISVLGPPAFDWIQSRVSTFLGLERRKRTPGTPLEAIEDFSDAELARLAEEGIESVEALVSSSIPRVYLNSRFGLERIAEWHDVGLLVTRVGASAAADLRGRWGIRGAVEIRRIASDPSRAEEAKVLAGIFQKTMRVDSPSEATLVIKEIATDERVALTEVLRRTLVRVDQA